MSGVKRPADKAWSEDYLKAARGEYDDEEVELPPPEPPASSKLLFVSNSYLLS